VFQKSNFRRDEKPMQNIPFICSFQLAVSFQKKKNLLKKSVNATALSHIREKTVKFKKTV
jgi:hypothetical protein